MLQRPDNQILVALASLKGNPQFETIKAWLESSLQDLYRESVETRDDVLSRWKQGGAQAVRELLDTAHQADEVLRKSRA